MRIRIVILCCIVGLFTVRCSHTDAISVNAQSYYPLRVGDYHLYQVVRTTYNQLTCASPANDTTKNYFLKTVVTDSLKSSEGVYTYTIQRYISADTTQVWTNLDTWSARITPNQLVVNEENIPYVKINFPLRDSAVWNGNLYNNLGEQDYKLFSHNIPYQLGNGKKFLNSLKVSVSNINNLVNQDIEFEVYAASVGLIYKQSSVLTYLTDGNCFGTKAVKTGIDYRQTLLRYGRQ
ncbi:MAG: hypothetical protein JST43_13815 [Bacteroidetes bacterium]|nr:hypothetical protein [Bacteroidota bacterium]MBS1539750.1 hypothetical protein [Bacteroidota bacterium]